MSLVDTPTRPHPTPRWKGEPNGGEWPLSPSWETVVVQWILCAWVHPSPHIGSTWSGYARPSVEGGAGLTEWWSKVNENLVGLGRQNDKISYNVCRKIKKQTKTNKQVNATYYSAMFTSLDSKFFRKKTPQKNGWTCRASRPVSLTTMEGENEKKKQKTLDAQADLTLNWELQILKHAINEVSCLP